MRIVKVCDLVAGQALASDVSNLRGQVIAPAGAAMSPRLLSILRAWGVQEVTVESDPLDPPPMVDPLAVVPSSEASEVPDDAGDMTHPALLEVLAIAARLKAKTTESRAGAISPVEANASDRSSAVARPHPSWQPISAETVAARAGTLATLPPIYFRVERAINHPASSSADIAAVLGSDQALSARLLRIANSAFYGFPRRVEGIGDAVRIIGTRQLHDLVLATVVLTQFRGVDSRLVSMKSFWQHSLACGLASRAIASLRRETNTERYFVAGLLHDIGSLVLYQHFAERAQVALDHHRHANLALDQAERTIIGCDHGGVGAALIGAWKLPQFFREAAGNHHCQGHRSHTAGTAIIHLADLMALALGLGSNGEERLPPFSHAAWDMVRLDVASLGPIADQVLAQFADTQRTFFSEDGSL